MVANVLDKDTFLNVDLEVFSKADLGPMVAAFGSRIHVHFIGKEFGLFKAYFDLAKQPKTPEVGILQYAKLIRALSPPARTLWDNAKSRSFDIGVEAPKPGRYYWSAVGPKAIRAAAEVGAQIAITVYGPMKTIRSTKAQRAIDSAERARAKRI